MFAIWEMRIYTFASGNLNYVAEVFELVCFFPDSKMVFLINNMLSKVRILKSYVELFKSLLKSIWTVANKTLLSVQAMWRRNKRGTKPLESKNDIRIAISNVRYRI